MEKEKKRPTETKPDRRSCCFTFNISFLCVDTYDSICPYIHDLDEETFPNRKWEEQGSRGLSLFSRLSCMGIWSGFQCLHIQLINIIRLFQEYSVILYIEEEMCDLFDFRLTYYLNLKGWFLHQTQPRVCHYNNYTNTFPKRSGQILEKNKKNKRHLNTNRNLDVM